MKEKTSKKTTKIRSFTDLNAWKEAHKLVLLIYEATDDFPKAELYSLTDQIRRCAVSISSNIAEGFSKQSKREKIHFYHTAKGSLTELQNQLLVAKDVGYLDQKTFKKIAKQPVTAHKLLNGLIKSAKSKK